MLASVPELIDCYLEAFNGSGVGGGVGGIVILIESGYGGKLKDVTDKLS